MDNNFIMLPNSLVWNYKNSNNTLTVKYGDNIVHILSYLSACTNRLDTTVFCLKDLIEFCGLTPKNGANKTNERFKQVLLQLQQDNIISDCNVDLTKVKVTDCISCKFNMPIQKDKNGNNTQFFTIDMDNYISIMQYQGKLNNITLLKVYYYINARVSRRENITIDGQVHKRDNINVDAGKANCFYDSYINICKDLNMTENTYNKYIKQLHDMGLIYYDNIGLVKLNNRTNVANNVYCLNVDELPEALKQSRLYYLDNGYTVIGKKTKAEIKKINGLKGKIVQETNKGNDVSCLVKKIDKLEKGRSKKVSNTNGANDSNANTSKSNSTTVSGNDNPFESNKPKSTKKDIQKDFNWGDSNPFGDDNELYELLG